MDDEKNQKTDEGDKNILSESVQEATKTVFPEIVHSDPFSNCKINTFSTEGQKNPEKKAEETGKAKRPLFESADQDFIETNILENEPVSKRLKLTLAEYTKENESKPPSMPVSEVSVDESNCTVDEAIEGTERCPCNDGFVPKVSCVPEGDTPQEIHVERGHSQEDEIVHPGSKSFFQENETSVSYTTGSTVNVSKCKTCERVFPTYIDLEKHIQETHLKQPKEHISLQPACKSEHIPSSKIHVKQAPGRLKLYFCDLCGFQSFEEDLLRGHFLGKTHLRRQKLAARGGFVKILTKKSFHKKQQNSCQGKNVRAKSTVNKPKMRNTYSNQLRTSNSKAKKLKASGQLFVEMIPSKDISRESVNSKEVFFCSADGNCDVQAEQNISGSSGCNPVVSESVKDNQETMSSLSTTGMFDRFHQKRHILARRIAFKQSGSFRLNQQIKRRYHLLGIGKRSKPDSNLKHSTAEECSQDNLSQVSLKGLGMEGDASLLNKTAPNKQELNPDGTDVCSFAMESDGSPKKAPDVQKPLHPCNPCGCSLQGLNGWALVVDREHGEELKFRCQTCGCSYTRREDFEEYCQKNSQHTGGFKMNCCHCSFLAPDYISLGKHMHDDHGMSHYCGTCHLYFLNEDEMAAHNAAEHHARLLSQNIFQPSNSEVTVQTASCTVMESDGFPKVDFDEVKTQQEIPRSSVVHPGIEFKESILSRSQFQCKKCFYKTRSSSVLTRHIKLRHAQEYHFLCKACNLYSLSKEGMEKHIKRSKHLENARKNNIGLRFEECIERVCVGTSDGKKLTEPPVYGNLKTGSENDMHVPFCTLENVSINKELFPSGETIQGGELVLDSAPKRGRPKGTISRTCPHCGLLASSVTNLTVHIRRKHSHQYSYLCKVCNYYTVTKGDMERHCATKKHKGRLEVNGKQNVEIIVSPEGGNVDVNRKKVASSVSVLNEPVDHHNQSSHEDISVLGSQEGDRISAIQMPAEDVLQLHELPRNQCSAEIKQQRIAELGSTSQDGHSSTQTRAANSNENQCDYCNFVAHSFSSLEVHVKRKHTKEFEYYCMACDYYAVTHREMIRHAATEKHKIKRQSYTCTSGEETDATDIAKEKALTSQEEHQPMEDFQSALSETKCKNNIEEKKSGEQTLKVEKLLNSAKEDSGASEGFKESHLLETVNVELEREIHQGGEHVDASFQKIVQKGEIVKLNEMIAFKQAIGSVLQENVDGQTTMKTNFDLTNGSGNKSLALGKESLDLNFSNYSNKLDKHGEKEFANFEVAEEVKSEAHLTVLSETCSIAEEKIMDESAEKAMQNMHILQGERSFHEGSTVEEERSLIDAQHEAEVAVHAVWGANGSKGEGIQESSNEAVNDFVSTYHRVKEGTAVESSGSFDSSIVKLKSHEEGCEPVDHFAEGQNLSGRKVCDLAMKVEASQSGGKKKKAEGNPVKEPTRIRCDDCGFLADGLSGLNVHITMKHPSKEKHFHCLLCGKSFYTESNLHQHLASAGHIRNEEASVEELPEGGTTFKCVKCTEPFDSEQNLFLHIKEQHEELLREVNKYIVEDTEQINREREENKGNICKYCGKICRSSHSMAFLAHIRTHTGMCQNLAFFLLVFSCHHSFGYNH